MPTAIPILFGVFLSLLVVTLGGLFNLWTIVHRVHPEIKDNIFPKSRQPTLVFSPAIRLSALFSPKTFGFSAYPDVLRLLRLLKWSAIAQVISFVVLIVAVVL